MITLLTDFGHQDVYVGVMKGVIASLCPGVQVVDLTHDIPPQDVAAARFALLSAYPYFPEGTIHGVVVDPGVGTARRAIAVQTDRAFLVGPDNGLFSGITDTVPVLAAVALTQPAYWRVPNPSQTFHGRDIFAPAMAHLARGVPLHRLGRSIPPESLTRLDIPPVRMTDQGMQGVVQYCDRFGNVITTIPATAVNADRWHVVIGDSILEGRTTYGAVPPGQPLALIGSHGYVEVAVNQGSAQQQLNLRVGDAIALRPAGS
ncbi:SAM-dependent chlorinase/fluorinase [Nodosilinea sp. P-1105]|uniref:SAM hydrolase/SAM-dependent halogenase family protein n=1 Tax=Nodosilinea sp. P-1105 TaxID=2546229 RepID=UPI00146A8FE7|nr:SAM-dependent chlorinase/fluorinase [Nodosilinea sp. P-1105]NMF86343.1 hypothetical protein [Nodosilinea sp. P-1105]